MNDADVWAVRANYPLRSRVTLRDGHQGAVEAVGYAGGLLSLWITGRGAVRLAEIVGRA